VSRREPGDWNLRQAKEHEAAGCVLEHPHEGPPVTELDPDRERQTVAVDTSPPDRRR